VRGLGVVGLWGCGVVGSWGREVVGLWGSFDFGYDLRYSPRGAHYVSCRKGRLFSSPEGARDSLVV
jgi:hypothetical protein